MERVRRGVDWFVRQRRSVQGAVGVSALLAVVLPFSLGIAAFGPHGTAKQTGSNSPQTQLGGTASARSGTPVLQKATPTHVDSDDDDAGVSDEDAPSRLHGPTLGGSMSSFYAYFNPLTNATETSESFQGTVSGVAVTFTVETQLGSDGIQHVHVIRFGPPQGTSGWSVTTAQQVAKHFTPQDATTLRTLHVSTGLDYVASSALLANTFSTTDFRKGTGSQTATPGTFDYQCAAVAGVSGGLGQCVMALGQQ